MQTKAEIMAGLLIKAEEMLEILNPEKKWRIKYLVFGPDNKQMFSAWDIERNRLRENDEYICIWDDEGYLLYTINVSANSAKWNMAELFKLIGDKF